MDISGIDRIKFRNDINGLRAVSVVSGSGVGESEDVSTPFSPHANKIIIVNIISFCIVYSPYSWSPT